MCGIAGVISRDPLGWRRQALAMARAMVHRGPDGLGEHHRPHLSLAMRRLSIIDLATGWQPFVHERCDLVLIANGEIYNHIELRAALEAKGHVFKTHSDCETILHGYLEHGQDVVHELRGMFAFALWDGRQRRLLLARDRMGEKPLYLQERPDRLVFASEMKALLASGEVPFALDPAGVNQFFHYQFAPDPLTCVQGVRKLEAGHLLTVELDPWTIRRRRWWRIEDAPPLDRDPAEAVREVLDEITPIITRADVPVGIALSGGFDSSAIASLVNQNEPGKLVAFTVGYPGRPPNDERGLAVELARDLGIAIHEVELSTNAMVDGFPKLVADRDDPIADIAGFGYSAVMARARAEGVPVMLQGQGGDELFWGYDWVRRAVHESREKRRRYDTPPLLPPFRLSDLEKPTGRDPLSLWLWLRMLFGLRQAFGRRHLLWGTPRGQLVFYELSKDFALVQKEHDRLFTAGFREAVRAAGREADPVSLYDRAPVDEDPAIGITAGICRTYLVENGITQGDRLSMAHSVELRLPLLDHRLVETVIGLRRRLDDTGREPKAWLKDAMRGRLPDALFSRPKQGFTPPVNDWYRALTARYGDSLRGGVLAQAQILRPEKLDLFARHALYGNANTPPTFKTLVLETWARAMQAIAADARATAFEAPVLEPA